MEENLSSNNYSDYLRTVNFNNKFHVPTRVLRLELISKMAIKYFDLLISVIYNLHRKITIGQHKPAETGIELGSLGREAINFSKRNMHI